MDKKKLAKNLAKELARVDSELATCLTSLLSHIPSMAENIVSIFDKLKQIIERSNQQDRAITLLIEMDKLNMEKQEIMDKKIIDVKKKNDKQMDRLVKEDIKRDKACDSAKGMAKKKK